MSWALCNQWHGSGDGYVGLLGGPRLKSSLKYLNQFQPFHVTVGGGGGQKKEQLLKRTPIKCNKKKILIATFKLNLITDR